MITFFSARNDLGAVKITRELDRRSIYYEWIDIAEYLKPLHLTHQLGGRDNYKNIVLQKADGENFLDKISVIYARSLPYVEIEKLDKSPYLSDWVNQEVTNYFRETLEMLDCKWFPCKPTLLSHLETEKFTELYDALEVGLRIPDTIVTSNPKSALEFYRKNNGRVISKRYYKSKLPYRNTDFVHGTSPVSLRDIGFINHIKISPTLFQEYVPKQKELRITVVGEDTVSAEIDSQLAHHTRHDWRNYDRYRTPYKEHKLPKEIHNKLVALVKKRGLYYGTCDMVITPQGEYVFLEINPAGQYAWIENILEIDITGLICDKIISLSEGNKAKKLRVANDNK